MPELQVLRRQHFGISNFAFPTGAAFLSDPASRGVQLEISARLTFPLFRTGRFGLRVLANASSRAGSTVAEYTEVGFERTANHSRVFVDRRRSSGGVRDADVRSGPWVPSGSLTTNLHVFVDRSIVTLIADNVTSISVWVHPTDVASERVALFSTVRGVKAERVDVWQLADPGDVSPGAGQY